ncbi:MAG: metal-dependent hydrolase [Sphingomonadales bacterium]|nr:metal-dependent hydrolase [Sphingomonadales bacterium]
MSGTAILVRRIPFAFDEKIDPAWHPRRREWSHMVNGASLAMPYLEPFLIRTVTEALKLVSKPDLKADVQAFIGQEGVHFQNHRRYNEILKQSYPELADVEGALEADYRRFQQRSLRWRLAYTAGFETMTMGITEWLIHQRSILFGNADRSVSLTGPVAYGRGNGTQERRIRAVSEPVRRLLAARLGNPVRGLACRHGLPQRVQAHA